MKRGSVRLQPASGGLGWVLGFIACLGVAQDASNPVPHLPGVTVQVIDPPEQGFYAKRLDYEGIPIKAPTNVVDEALFAAHGRLSVMLTHLPSVRVKLRAAGAELHIIGRDQVTTDLPEWRHDKGKPLEEYHGLTRDERTRGMGGLLTSCGEENLLRLEQDRYRGRDICVHEFAHNILGHGVSREVRERIREQHRRSLARGLWVGSYAGSNPHEFFAELAMWYFGTRGDLGMQGAKPADGRDGLKAYDPEAFALLDEFFSGGMEPAEPQASSDRPAAVRRPAPAPLFRDPVHDGAADPTLVWNRLEQCWWILYTNRRADADGEKGVKWVHGTDIGIASTPDAGATWKYRGIARGLEFEPGRNTFWAPEVVDFGGRYHAFISYVRGVPETWAGSRDILHYTSTNLLDWKFEGVVVPGSIDACVHRLPDGTWRMWFKNEQRKIPGTTLDSDDLYTWKPTRAEMPDPDPGKGEGPDVVFWKRAFWMVKDMWKGLGLYRSADASRWEFKGIILDRPGKRPGDHKMGQHPGFLLQDADTCYLVYFVHQAEKEPAYRHTWLQAAKLGFDGNTLTCDRDAEFDFVLKPAAAEFTAEHIPAIPRR